MSVGKVPDDFGLRDSPRAASGLKITEGTISKASPTEIAMPGDLKHVFIKTGTHLIGAVLDVLGVAIGQAVVLRTALSPSPINPGLGFVICDEQSEVIEGACQAIAQPLRDIADRKLTRMCEGANDIEEQIRQVESQRRAFFGADIVRDEKADAQFLAKLEGLRSLLHSTMVVENPRPGRLSFAVGKNGGGGLLAYFNDGWFSQVLDSVTKNPIDLEILIQSFQGKTPEISYSGSQKERPIVRPVVGVLSTCIPETMSRLVCSQDPVVHQFVAQLMLARAPLANPECLDGAGIVRLPEFWPSRIERFVALRDSGVRRQLTLSPAAAAALSAYVKEVGKHLSEQQRWRRKSAILAAKISIILHVWKGTDSDELTEKTMRTAIELSQWLAQESAATACAYAAAEQDRVVRRAAAVMLEKLHHGIKKLGRPVTRRELYQKYNDESRALHDPVLEFLLRAGQARWVDGGRLEPAAETLGHSND